MQKEILLWRSVVKRAILDACGIYEDSKMYRKHKEHVKKSVELFYTKDCVLVCDYADLDYHIVFKTMRKTTTLFKSHIHKSTLLSIMIDKILSKGDKDEKDTWYDY